jgi:hypothetical protein
MPGSHGSPGFSEETTMNLEERLDSGLETLPSAHSAPETVKRVKALLAERGIELFADIDSGLPETCHA